MSFNDIFKSSYLENTLKTSPPFLFPIWQLR